MRFSFPLPNVVAAADDVVEVEDGAGRREVMVRFFGGGAVRFAGSVAGCECGCCCCCGTLAEVCAEVEELLAGVAMRERLAWDAVLGLAGCWD